ncbi:MAG: type 2 isopentenyl-diphosphate Delta-isomerase [Phascolarctobacterium sp.]|nr:type 2 isopentenyl-diphosphate Delta-isomerase [Phascolarctobacterium sp.]
MQRAQRKLAHIKYALALEDGPTSTHLADIRFVHNCLPEISPADIDLSCEILGKQLRLPFFIDSITGGAQEVARINRDLAEVASILGCGIASGSEYGAVHNEGVDLSSYKIIRETNPCGFVLGNISGQATTSEAQKAIDLLEADALEIHLNVAQELFMAEGDRDFSKILENISAIIKSVSVPVIIKETGCGIAYEEYVRFEKCGAKFFNCAGAGGTNFIAIEAARTGKDPRDMLAWGHPTCWSLLDAHDVLQEASVYFASGGIRTGLDIAKAFALGASAIGIAGPILKAVQAGGVQAGVDYLQCLANELKNIMTLLNVRKVSELKNVPLMILGETKDYCVFRNYGLDKLQRSR